MLYSHLHLYSEKKIAELTLDVKELVGGSQHDIGDLVERHVGHHAVGAPGVEGDCTYRTKLEISFKQGKFSL